MAHSQLLFDVLAIGLGYLPLSCRVFGKLSRMKCLFVLHHVSSHKHKPEAQMSLPV
jgi:hypothetical protein